MTRFRRAFSQEQVPTASGRTGFGVAEHAEPPELRGQVQHGHSANLAGHSDHPSRASLSWV